MKKYIHTHILITLFSVCAILAYHTVHAEILDTPLTNGVYYSDIEISAQDECSIESGVTVRFLSEGTIRLLPEFHAKPGSDFKTIIGDYSALPPDMDLDEDGMPASWEVQYGLDPAFDDSLIDSDDDGLSNSDEYARGTYPDDEDSDDDGMSDGWEVLNEFNPLSDADAALDADGDGLSNLGEYGLGSDPHNSFNSVARTEGDLILPETTPTGYYFTSNNILTNETLCVIHPGSTVWCMAGGNTFLRPGFKVTDSVLGIINGGYEDLPKDLNYDDDVFPDWWELFYFGDLLHEPGDDFDGDGVTNYVEFKLETVPNDSSDMPKTKINYQYNERSEIESAGTVAGVQE